MQLGPTSIIEYPKFLADHILIFSSLMSSMLSMKLLPVGWDTLMKIWVLLAWGIARIEFARKFWSGGVRNGPATKFCDTWAMFDSVWRILDVAGPQHFWLKSWGPCGQVVTFEGPFDFWGKQVFAVTQDEVFQCFDANTGFRVVRDLLAGKCVPEWFWCRCEVIFQQRDGLVWNVLHGWLCFQGEVSQNRTPLDG